jgi:ribonucleoside-diphosphate reductase alpha chain
MERQRLPDERPGLTHKFTIKGPKQNHTGYLTVGFYEDGKIGEIFVKMDSQGSQVSGFIDAWAISVSMLLQTGTSLETICNKFRGHAFPPEGMTSNKKIPFTRSPIDYIARWLEMKFVDPGLEDDADQS